MTSVNTVFIYRQNHISIENNFETYHNIVNLSYKPNEKGEETKL